MDGLEVERARRLHQEAVVIDTCGYDPVVWSDQSLQTLNHMIDTEKPIWQIFQHWKALKVRDLISDESVRLEYVRRFQESGVTATSFTLGSFGRFPFSYENAIKDLALWTAKFDALPDVLKKVTRAKDIEDVKNAGKHSIILQFQNTTHIQEDIDKIQFFYDFGVRVIQLTYNSQNLVGAGCTERSDAGLSNFGLQVVEKLNELNILIDGAHCGPQTLADTLEFSTAPIAVTHISCRDIYDYVRGKTDDQLQAVAEKGGFIGIVNVPFFLTNDPKPTLAHMMDHIDHTIDLVGTDHVGIGTDWPESNPRQLNELLNEEIRRLGFRSEHRVDFNALTEGFERQDKWPNITTALVARGYSDQEIKKILGENFLRLFRKVVG